MPLDKFTPPAPELIDILNEEGQPAGNSKPICEVHRQGLWHRTVHIWICTSRGELLLQRRSLAKQASPGLWDISCAGHISAGEASLPAAVRECTEELGYTPQAAGLALLFSVKSSMALADGGMDREYNDVYLHMSDRAIESYKPDPVEVIGLCRMHWKELRALVNEGHPDYVRHPEEYDRLFAHLSSPADFF